MPCFPSAKLPPAAAYCCSNISAKNPNPAAIATTACIRPCGLTARCWCKNYSAACTAPDNALPPVISPTFCAVKAMIGYSATAMTSYPHSASAANRPTRNGAASSASASAWLSHRQRRAASTLQLTEAAKKVLKGETEVMLRPLRREKTATPKTERRLVAYRA